MNLLLIFLCLLFFSTQNKNVSQNFKADSKIKYDIFNVNGEYIFNTKRNQYLFSGENMIFGTKVDFSIVEVNGTTKEVTAGQCHDAPQVALDGMFGWLEYGTYTGDETIIGQKCSMYSLYVEQLNYTLYMCVREDSLPVYFGLLLADGTYQSQFYFRNQVKGDFPVVVPEVCSLPLNTCKPEDPVVQTMEMVRFHDSGDYSLANENTADMMGDVYYVCMSKVSNETSNSNKDVGGNKQRHPKEISYSVISTFEVTVNTTWGQYSLCNYRMCCGGLEGTVGREVALGVAPWGGQCATNKVKGSWYSTLARDECKGDKKVGDDGCAWKTKSVKKSIDYSCIKSHGFEDACLSDAHPPFTKSYKIFKQAFESDVISEGGCPDVRPKEIIV